MLDVVLTITDPIILLGEVGCSSMPYRQCLWPLSADRIGLVLLHHSRQNYLGETVLQFIPFLNTVNHHQRADRSDNYPFRYDLMFLQARSRFLRKVEPFQRDFLLRCEFLTMFLRSRSER